MDPSLIELAADQFGGSAQSARAYLNEPGTLAFVATAGDEVVGWCWGGWLTRLDGTLMLYLHQLEVGDHWSCPTGRSSYGTPSLGQCSCPISQPM